MKNNSMVSILFLVSTACKQYDSAEDFYEFPKDSIVQEADTKLALMAWTDAGLANPKTWPKVTKAIVNFSFFKEVCGNWSCNDPKWQASGTRNCIHACAHHIEDGVPVMFFARPLGQEIEGHGEDQEVVHETFHTWSFCLKQNSDKSHPDKQIWQTAMEFVK